MSIFADRIIFPGRNSYQDNPDIFKIKTPDGIFLSAMYLPSPNSDFTILYCHGNGEDLGDIRPILEMFQINGYSILSYDYRGYGTSQGSVTEKNAYQDIETVYAYLLNDLHTPAERIIVLGRSVGGGSATHLASRKKVAGVILESAFISAFRVVTRISLFPGDKFNNLEKIKTIHCPVLVMHGTKDWLIPCWHGRKLYEDANELKLQLWVEGAGHNDLVWVADQAYWQKIKEFTQLIDNR